MNKQPGYDSADFFVADGSMPINCSWVVRSISQSYWGGHRTSDQILTSILNSMCFGVYRQADMKQVGFARVVTDKATFSWICDVIIDPDFRGLGLGSMLIDAITNSESIKGTVQVLGTRDAHAFYEKAGFKRCEQMKKIPGQ